MQSVTFVDGHCMTKLPLSGGSERVSALSEDLHQVLEGVRACLRA